MWLLMNVPRTRVTVVITDIKRTLDQPSTERLEKVEVMRTCLYIYIHMYRNIHIHIHIHIHVYAYDKLNIRI